MIPRKLNCYAIVLEGNQGVKGAGNKEQRPFFLPFFPFLALAANRTAVYLKSQYYLSDWDFSMPAMLPPICPVFAALVVSASPSPSST